MNKIEPTPGPWTARAVQTDWPSPASGARMAVDAGPYKVVASCEDMRWGRDSLIPAGQAAANAHLIAAAPDLRDACTMAAAVLEQIDAELRRQWGDSEGDTPELTVALETCRFALAKSHGETTESREPQG